MSLSLGSIGSFVDTYTSGSGTVTIPTNAYLAEVLLIGGGGGSGGSNTTYAGGGGGAGGYGIFFVPIATSFDANYDYSVGIGGPGGTSGATGSTGGNTTFTLNGTTITSNGGLGGASGTTGTGGAGGTSPTVAGIISINNTGEAGYSTGGNKLYGSSGGGIGGALGGLTAGNNTSSGPSIDGTGGGGSSKGTTSVTGASGLVQITWYITTGTSNTQLSKIGISTYLFNTTDTPFYIPAPQGALSAQVLLIGAGGKGGNYSGSTGGSGGGQGVIANFGFPVCQGQAKQIFAVGTTTNSIWYGTSWETNKPTGGTAYWIYMTSLGNITAPGGPYFVFYGNYNNTSYTSAYVAANCDDYGSVIINGNIVFPFAEGGSGGGFNSTPLVNLKYGNNSIIFYTRNYSPATAVNNAAGIWLALTTSSGGGGTLLYQTDSSWTWSSMYSCYVGSSSSATSSRFTVNTTHDFSLNATNSDQGLIFIAGQGPNGVNASSSAVNSGPGYLLANNFNPTTPPTGTTPNGTNTNIATNGVTMFISGSQGSGASAGSGGAGGSFFNGAGGVTPSAGQTNGGGGGGGGGSTTNTGALGGNGLAMVTFYGAPTETALNPIPVSLGNVATKTNIYSSGTATVVRPAATFMLKLYLLGPGGNGGISASPSAAGGGGGSGALGIWLMPFANNGGATYTYTVGTPGTNTTFAINSALLGTNPTTFTANAGSTGGASTGGGGGTAPSSPDTSVNMVASIAGASGVAGASGGKGGGLYGGAGSASVNGTNGGVGSGGGGCPSGKTAGTGGNGLIVAVWYFKYADISLTNYTNGPLYSVSGKSSYSNSTPGTYTNIAVSSSVISFDVFIIPGCAGGGGGGGTPGVFRGGGGGSGGHGGYLTVTGITYVGGDITTIVVGSGGTLGAGSIPGTGGTAGFPGGTATNSSITYNGITYTADITSGATGGNGGTGASSFNAGLGGAGGAAGTGFNPSSGTGVTVVNGSAGNKGTNGSGGGAGAASVSFTVSYSDGNTQTFSSGSGGNGGSSGGAGSSGTAGSSGCVYIVYYTSL